MTDGSARAIRNVDAVFDSSSIKLASPALVETGQFPSLLQKAAT